MEPTVPTTSPHRIAADTWLIPNLAPAGPDVYLPVNSMLIRGSEPIVVDTGAPIHRDHWFEEVFSLVEPEDVKWVFVSHDDGDHVGNLHELLELCPNATLVANFFITVRMALERPLPIQRMRWVGPGESLDAGDRRLHLMVPPIFDGPTTRGLYDENTAVLWAVDSFAALAPGAVHEVADIPRPMFDDTFGLLNTSSPRGTSGSTPPATGPTPTPSRASACWPSPRPTGRCSPAAPSRTRSTGSGPWRASPSSPRPDSPCSTRWSPWPWPGRPFRHEPGAAHHRGRDPGPGRPAGNVRRSRPAGRPAVGGPDRDGRRRAPRVVGPRCGRRRMAHMGDRSLGVGRLDQGRLVCDEADTSPGPPPGLDAVLALLLEEVGAPTLRRPP